MKVLVACLEDKTFEYRGNADGLTHSPTWPHFSMPCVLGDDWLRRINCLLRPEPVDVRQLDTAMFVLYQARTDALAFSAWLTETTAEQERGYRTMRG